MSIEKWVNEIIPKHKNLTAGVITIVQSLLRKNGIDYLSVTGRTKDCDSVIQKIRRKGYKDPKKQLTDITGVRIIVFIESDIQKISKIIEESFNVDKDNSLNKDALLSTDQIGYRSVHYVCSLGDKRTSLPEFADLEGLKFEFQIRTVLQHAWAEIAHDRNYKFAGTLPHDLERKLYLYAGMLEIADNGFNELSSAIDLYKTNLQIKSSNGDLDTEINSLSLEQFVLDWSKNNDYKLKQIANTDLHVELVRELGEFGIKTLSELQKIIPARYLEISKEKKMYTNIYGLVRDWMLISDYKKFLEKVKFSWEMGSSSESIFQYIMPEEEYNDFYQNFYWDDDKYYELDEDYVNLDE